MAILSSLANLPKARCGVTQRKESSLQNGKTASVVWAGVAWPGLALFGPKFSP